MVAINILLASLLITLTSAVPTRLNLNRRAGGPAAVPIPANCTVKNPLPTSTSPSTVAYAPAPSTTSAYVYSAYYYPFSTNQTALFTQCLEQCYGYGNKGECVAAYLASNVPAPPLFGSPGGQLETACLMYNRTLTPADFVVASPGTYTDARCGNIVC
ncbi:hypothetical protein K432DRAFT_377134 [Lepidopterella palustris CBS 459.81]|uniref:Apple domain-containing protein n=1 Tax=Lepidopterella palustris CBS 459.81 TaxID=1314670 RepID=A0A8E2ELL3_9PEZI|nr:hypothetical protein K432DRAFT_377134 [Lepidopterella palustris CBS 459.81]